MEPLGSLRPVGAPCCAALSGTDRHFCDLFPLSQGSKPECLRDNSSIPLPVLSSTEGSLRGLPVMTLRGASLQVSPAARGSSEPRHMHAEPLSALRQLRRHRLWRVSLLKTNRKKKKKRFYFFEICARSHHTAQDASFRVMAFPRGRSVSRQVRTGSPRCCSTSPWRKETLKEGETTKPSFPGKLPKLMDEEALKSRKMSGLTGL